MTFDEILECKKDCLTPADVAPVIGCDPYTINICARDCPERLGFPIIMLGKRVKIPRLAFVAFMTGKYLQEGVAQ